MGYLEASYMWVFQMIELYNSGELILVPVRCQLTSWLIFLLYKQGRDAGELCALHIHIENFCGQVYKSVIYAKNHLM